DPEMQQPEVHARVKIKFSTTGNPGAPIQDYANRGQFPAAIAPVQGGLVEAPSKDHSACGLRVTDVSDQRAPCATIKGRTLILSLGLIERDEFGRNRKRIP